VEIRRRIADFIAKIVKKKKKMNAVALSVRKKRPHPFFLLYRVVGETL